jgi:hypothetical protein
MKMNYLNSAEIFLHFVQILQLVSNWFHSFGDRILKVKQNRHRYTFCTMFIRHLIIINNTEMNYVFPSLSATYLFDLLLQNVSNQFCLEIVSVSCLCSEFFLLFVGKFFVRAEILDVLLQVRM